jgi:hypothetical protein
MKVCRIFNYASIAALAALWPLGIASSRGSTAPSVLDAPALQEAHPQRIEWWGEERKHKLRHAYRLLEFAKRDYDGHRIKAKAEVKKAADILGLDLHGGGYDWEPGESRWESDKMLRESRRLLKEVREETGGGEEHKHLRIAIHEIDTALGE